MIQQVVTARVQGLPELPDLSVYLVTGLSRQWRAAHCCQILYVASDQAAHAMMRSVLDGVADMLRHHRHVTRPAGCAHRDELAQRRRGRTG